MDAYLLLYGLPIIFLLFYIAVPIRFKPKRIRCPQCGGLKVHWKTVQYGPDEMSQKYDCQNCGSGWVTLKKFRHKI